MAADGEVTITVHGLDVDNGIVRADVFIEKFRALLGCLKNADKVVNEKKSHEFMIVGLEAASAHATLREKVSTRRFPASSVRYCQGLIEAVYNGDRNIGRYPPEMVRSLGSLVTGVDKRFSHGEIKFTKNNVVRIDDYFAKQVDKAIRRTKGELSEQPQRYFEGIAFETLDGVVKEMDARGTLVRGKLVLTVGSKELDCVFNTADIQILRDSFDKRARVDGVAHYDGISPLPVRLDVRKIELINIDGDLRRWKGALRRPRTGNRLGDD